jgi:hypothetical protein
MKPSFAAPVPRSSLGSAAARALLHLVFLLIALACLAGYLHLKAEDHPDAALASLVAAALFGFMPLRDLIHIFFRIEGTALHLVHAVGGLALVALPLSGAVSGTPLLTHTAMAPFAIMAAAQAVMHQNQPRNARQAAALRQFAASLPQVAQFTSGNLSSPENARRAMVVLTDIVGKAQTLGQTELDADPNFQSALGRVSTRFGAGLGLDAVDLALNRLAANPATAAAVPALRQRVTAARGAISRGTERGR